MWSAAVALLGLGVSRLASVRLGERIPAERHWLVGLLALAPAWLLEFVRMIGAAEAPTAGSRLPFVGAVGLGLLGVIASDAAARRLRESAASRPPLHYWVLGAATLVPAWLLALAARAWVGP
jgi:hypothetical protein